MTKKDKIIQLLQEQNELLKKINNELKPKYETKEYKLGNGRLKITDDHLMYIGDTSCSYVKL
jgi:hypothetical protein